MLHLLRTLFGRPSLRSSERKAVVAGPRLSVEALEDRCVPTVAFLPQFGAETLNPPANGAANYTVLSNASVNLIFWGTYWGKGAGPSQESTLSQDAQTIL